MEQFNRHMHKISLAAAVISLTGLLVSSGCGGPPEAGSINMSKAKEVAAERGIPEKKAATTPTSKIARKPTGPRPTQALPKGGR